jgi:carboxypeptidase family protein
MKQTRLVFAVCWAAAVSVALIAAPHAAAQKKGAGVLTGVVLGPDDKPVPHASITYQSGAGIAPHAVHADAHGHFTITKLHTDVYDLRASGRGAFSEWEKNVSVRSGQTKSITLRLIYAKEIPKAYVKSKPAQQ